MDKRIISVSRRTDIPAFYGQWFMERVCQGFVGVVHPYGGRKFVVSLRPEDVSALVFWSKDFGPFLENLPRLEEMGYRFYFNYTITAVPGIFEANVDKSAAIESLKRLSKMYSPQRINWRFDPIIVSETMGPDYWLAEFERLAAEFAGYVERCYFSFVKLYSKVKRNIDRLTGGCRLRVIEPSSSLKIDLAGRLADVAERFGMRMFCCCDDELVGGKIQKAHCVDAELIDQLFPQQRCCAARKPTRPQCGCSESIDIGAYDTCPGGCIYCYANSDKKAAVANAARHDVRSAFLGCSISESEKWLQDIRKQPQDHLPGEQAMLFE